jgi:hypothetical protein
MARKKSMTPRRAAAMLIHHGLDTLYYWSESAPSGITQELVEEISQSMSELLDPFEDRLLNLYSGLNHDDLDALFNKHLTPEARVDRETTKLYEDRYNMTEGAYFRGMAAIYKKHGVTPGYELQERIAEHEYQP